MKQTFLRLAGVDEEIDAFELQEILSAGFKKELQGKEFSIDACRSLVAMYDGDLSGKLGFDDFTELWSELRKWRGVFGKYDQDNSGYFSSFELRQALHATGFTVSNKVLQGITARFNNKNGHIMFDDFVSCLARLKTMINSFKGDDDQSPGFGPSELDRKKLLFFCMAVLQDLFRFRLRLFFPFAVHGGAYGGTVDSEIWRGILTLWFELPHLRPGLTKDLQV
ncbi:calpain-a [Plakobranchus ocellatus]|uniref:Calpain-a n=1 Tax=Plakobranchus ocellatus TaxID=259542 RepID=A0AAV4CUS6_9GAST|nr:calpain-a [Plakobranchus ocellatus]